MHIKTVSKCVSRYRDLDAELEEEDMDDLMREGLKQERDAAGQLEPALYLCWAIVAVVTAYVVFLGLHGARDGRDGRDEL